MRFSSATAPLLLAVGLGACAAPVPTVDLEPVAAVPDSPPLWWFADNWGPFEAVDVEGGLTARNQPIFIVDGQRILPSRERALSILDHIIEGPGLQGSPGEFEEVLLFRHRCDKMLFGEAAAGGIVMAFSAEFDGPRPAPDAGHTYEVSPDHPPGETCHRETP